MNSDVQHPFTDDEKAVMDAIDELHNKFLTLIIQKGLYHRHVLDWSAHIHGLQKIMIAESTMNKFPEYFNNGLC